MVYISSEDIKYNFKEFKAKQLLLEEQNKLLTQQLEKEKVEKDNEVLKKGLVLTSPFPF